MKEIKFEVMGIPQAQKRAKFFRRGKFVQVTDPSAVDKEDFASVALYYAPEETISSEVELTIRFYFPRPKYHYGTGRRSMIKKPSAPINHSKKPDIDNCIKFVLDSLNKIYWKDDAQVYFVTASKHYTDNDPRTEIRLNYE